MKISVITPTLNEAGNIHHRARELAMESPPWEWIVVDGGSNDETAVVARRMGAKVIVAARGRGTQLNTGAQAASGDILLFLHADTALPHGALDAIRGACRKTRIVGGNFTFSFADPSLAGRFLSAVYAAKQRVFRVWYGDSAIFVRADTFQSLGGFKGYPILEDIDFVERLRARGRTVRLPLVVRSLARRYRGRFVATVARWSGIFALYKLGISPNRLARFYPPHGES